MANADKTLIEIRDALLKYLAGNLSYQELSRWASRHPMCFKGSDAEHQGQARKGKLIDYAFCTLFEASPDEPEEYRATSGELKEVVDFIEGKKPFEGEFIKTVEAASE